MKLTRFIIGKILSVILAVGIVLFLTNLAQLKLVPQNLFVAVAALLGLLLVLVLALTWSGKGIIRMTIGVILTITMSVGLFVGTPYIHKALRVISSITDVQTEIVHMGVYISSDNAEYKDADAPTYQYGILQKLDRENTDTVIQQMNETLEAKISCKEYASITALVDALLNDEVDAIILNQVFLDLVEDIEEYENIKEKIREVEIKKVEVPIVKPTLPPPTTEATDPTQQTEPAKPKSKAFCVYMSGIDAWGSVNVRSRSDVNIVAVINPDTRHVLLISTPRDYFVPLSISNGARDKLTHAGIYGINVSKDTLGMLYGIDIEYYFRVNFSGFEQIVDALGGVYVYSEYNFSSGGYNFYEGSNYVGGKEALAFCRNRKSFAVGDRQRGKNQMALIKGVIQRMMSPALLKNYSSILSSIEGCFTTSMPMEKIGELVAKQLQSGGEWNVVSYSVNGYDDYDIPYSQGQYAYVMPPDYETVDYAKKLIQDVIDGKIVDP